GPVWAAVLASGTLRALYGFLALFFAFRTREDHLTLPPAAALGVIGAALAAGSFASTLAGARIGLRHPRIVQSLALATAAVACLGAAIGYSLWAAAALAFVTAVGSGLAKLSVDAVIQERLPDESRASAFAHSETLLQVAWVAGGALGLIPVSGRWGLLAAGILVAAAAGRSVTLAWSLRVKQPDPRPVA
ncbi:MAG: putative transporter, partial [Actinomycetia bacterium]|nr:putative transporter [Actinomycetes bacterium]